MNLPELSTRLVLIICGETMNQEAAQCLSKGLPPLVAHAQRIA